MSVKRMSLRFNLDNEAERKAWEYLKNATDSKNKAVITAINFMNHTQKLQRLSEKLFVSACKIFLQYRRNQHSRPKHYPKKKMNLWIPSICFSVNDGIRVVPLFYALKCPGASFWYQIKIKEDFYYESLFIIKTT